MLASGAHEHVVFVAAFGVAPGYLAHEVGADGVGHGSGGNAQLGELAAVVLNSDLRLLVFHREGDLRHIGHPEQLLSELQADLAGGLEIMAADLHFDVAGGSHHVHGHAHGALGACDLLELFADCILELGLAALPFVHGHQPHANHSRVHTLGEDRHEPFADPGILGDHETFFGADRPLDVLDHLADDLVGLLEIVADRRFHLHHDERLVILRDELGRQSHSEGGGAPEQPDQGDAHDPAMPPQNPIQSAPIPLAQSPEDSLFASRASERPLGTSRPEQARCRQRDEAHRDHQRYRERKADGDGHVPEQDAGNPGHEQHGHKHADRGQGRGGHSRTHGARTVHGSAPAAVPLLPEPKDVLQNHDGVVHEHADGEGQPRHGQDVQGHVRLIHHGKGGDHADRNRRGHDGGAANVAQEKQQHKKGDGDSHQARRRQVAQGLVDELGLVEDRLEFDVRGRSALDLGQRVRDRLCSADGVGARLLAHHHPDGGLAVDLQNASILAERVDHLGYVLEAHGHGPPGARLRPDHHLPDFVDVFVLARGLDGEIEGSLLHGSAGELMFSA